MDTTTVDLLQSVNLLLVCPCSYVMLLWSCHWQCREINAASNAAIWLRNNATASNTTLAYCSLVQGDAIHLESSSAEGVSPHLPELRCLGTNSTVLLFSSNGAATIELATCRAPSSQHMRLLRLLSVLVINLMTIVVVCTGVALLVGMVMPVHVGMRMRRGSRRKRRKERQRRKKIIKDIRRTVRWILQLD